MAISVRLASTEATFQTKPFKLHKLDSGPDVNVHVTKEDAVHYYTQMQVLLTTLFTYLTQVLLSRQQNGSC